MTRTFLLLVVVVGSLMITGCCGSAQQYSGLMINPHNEKVTVVITGCDDKVICMEPNEVVSTKLRSGYHRFEVKVGTRSLGAKSGKVNKVFQDNEVFGEPCDWFVYLP